MTMLKLLICALFLVTEVAPAPSQVRQNFHEDSEAGINKQINLELYASYVYMSMASYFGHDDVSLDGFARLFLRMSEEERQHANVLVDYQNKRGGHVVYREVKQPDQTQWGSGLDAMESALELEKHMNQALLDLYRIADRHADPQMQDFLNYHFLKEEVTRIKQLGDYVTKLKRVGDGLGEYNFDRDVLGGGK
ncbi:soma ferritin-like isoform X2 [Branchiostoma floridae]|uniref:Ferritin n=1 Tax=Branchiostoma floridae TaxID=7739 RepID=A0A9J7MWT2_BRAFL|nr:soma ferritin-like isoform X2 [Branchiostoma floridae]